MSKKTVCLIILTVLAVIQQIDATEEERKEACVGWDPRSVDQELPDILQGFALEMPVICHTVDDYVAKRAGQPCKLAIGAGHIHELSELHPDYQPEGDNCLTESVQGGYEFHRHIGWYTFSAETDSAFNSDMIGNVRVDSHQRTIFTPYTWNIIWDESYHPDVLSAPNLFEKIFESLALDGKFIFTVPIRKKSGYFVIGHLCSNETVNPSFSEMLAYENLSGRFISLEEIEIFIRGNLIKIGFSKADVYLSPYVKVISEKNQGKFPETEKEWSQKLEEEWDQIMDESTARAADPEKNPLLAIDEIFQHTGGLCYVVAKK